MAKLTDTQLIILSKAAAREDGIATMPEKLNKAAAAKIGSSLVARKLMREIRSKLGMPIWREDEDGWSFSLMITSAGRKAIHAGDGTDAVELRKANPPTRAKVGDADADAPAAKSQPRVGSKQALVVKMLSAKSGTTLDALVDATGWLPHTTRAALTGLRKRGYMVERSRAEGKVSVYRIAKPADGAAAA